MLEFEGGIGQVNYLYLVGELRSKEGFKKILFLGSRARSLWDPGGMETGSVSGLEMSWEKMKTPCGEGSSSDEEIHGAGGGRIIRCNGKKGNRRSIL